MEFSVPVTPTLIGPSFAAGDSPLVPPTRDSTVAPNSPSFAEVFRSIASRIDEGEKLVAGVERARGSLDATQLLALQAGVYRYSEAVELAAKLVDRMGSAVKTALQSQ